MGNTVHSNDNSIARFCIHEVSREKNADGELAYEAWIRIAWEPKNGEYVVMWLDNTGTTNFTAEGVGHGKPSSDRIPFVWKSAGGVVFTILSRSIAIEINGRGQLTTLTKPTSPPHLQE